MLGLDNAVPSQCDGQQIVRMRNRVNLTVHDRSTSASADQVQWRSEVICTVSGEAEFGDEVAHFVERERGAERVGEELALVGVASAA